MGSLYGPPPISGGKNNRKLARVEAPEHFIVIFGVYLGYIDIMCMCLDASMKILGLS